MQKLLLTSLFIACLPVVALAVNSADGDQERIVISNSAEFTAREVFVGVDEEMPLNGKWLISVNPTRDRKGNVIVPKKLEEAMIEMKKSLPHWFIVALMKSEGDYECHVFVNDAEMRGLVGAWFWSNWNLDSEQSSLHKEFNRLGVERGLENTIMSNALMGGFCAYVKTGDMGTALDVIASFADFEEELARQLELELEEENKKPGS